MLSLSFCQIPVGLLSYSALYTKKLELLNRWVNDQHSDYNQKPLRVGMFYGSEYFDKIAELYNIIKQLPTQTPSIEAIDFHINHIELYITHQSLKPIDFEVSRMYVDYKLHNKSIRTKTNRRSFLIQDYFDLISSYIEYPYNDPDYFTQLQLHMAVVTRYNGNSMFLDSYKFIKSHYLY
jgi:hypothetical protein